MRRINVGLTLTHLIRFELLARAPSLAGVLDISNHFFLFTTLYRIWYFWIMCFSIFVIVGGFPPALSFYSCKL